MLAPAAEWGWGLVHTAPSCIDQHPGALEYPRKGSRARHGRVAFLEYRKGPGRDSLLVIKDAEEASFPGGPGWEVASLLSVFHWPESWSWVWRKGLATTWDTSSHPLPSLLVPNTSEQMWGRAFGGTPGSRWWSEMTSIHFLVQRFLTRHC